MLTVAQLLQDFHSDGFVCQLYCVTSPVRSGAVAVKAEPS